ncbi:MULTISPECIES: hypothetical protein [Actinoalloteichus]|uniref:Uncharacterized protein n=1 Tax=Actinoalloteichus fjordicus TaxID=1612552 RepID=A0AAC9PTY4_9PSEU|nr:MULTISPECIES: hypothetical protein [Actinoalloteichus]APU16371.1 hypothetical protein UA74_21745 [Actinoalloteichus fjordicus]APU22429.1 hypothetical protein UA75_22215 [Actinoalloteichus sp. GBA129-24]
MAASHRISTPAQVQQRWQARQAPDGDFIVFADGSLSAMEFERFVEPVRFRWWETLRAEAWTPMDWLEVDDVLASCTHGRRRASAGESAAHGSVGWVALTSADGRDTLEWLAVSRYSDPFSSVTLDDRVLSATSTSGQVWRFPCDAPADVTISDGSG